MITCNKFTNRITKAKWYVLQAYDEAIVINDVNGNRTLYEDMTKSDFPASMFECIEWDIAYVLTLYMSVHGRNRAILKLVDKRNVTTNEIDE